MSLNKRPKNRGSPSHQSLSKRDPSVYYGPGYWDVIHRLAMTLCDQPEQAPLVVDTCFAIMRRFPCSVCRGHIEEYLEANPVSVKCLSQSGNSCWFFRWTWRYHNVVNHRKGKPLLPYGEAYARYQQPLATCPSQKD